MKNSILNYKGYEIVESNMKEGWWMTSCGAVVGETIEEVKHDIEMFEKPKPILVTIYYKGDFGMGVNKIEGKLIETGQTEYAQYNNAPYITMIPKGKRKARRYMQTYDPYLIILKGHGHPTPSDGMVVIDRKTPGVVVTQSKYSSFDSRWGTEFDTEIDKYIEESKVNVIGDYRESKGYSSYSGHAKISKYVS